MAEDFCVGGKTFVSRHDFTGCWKSRKRTGRLPLGRLAEVKDKEIIGAAEAVP
jgi:hypothetical protein